MTYVSIAARGVTAAAMLFAAAPSFAADLVYGPGGTIALGTGGYTQNFNSLTPTGTTFPNGLVINETGSNANSTYATGTGSDNTGDVYNFGATGSADRALGTLLSGSLVPSFGLLFSNATGAAITGLNIGYTGEQWRNGSTSLDSLTFQYSLTSTNIADAANSTAWISLAALTFTAPTNTTASIGALDGNAAANRSVLSTFLSGLSIASGSSFAFRWLDVDAAGADDGLAVDDFSLSAVTATGAVPEPTTWAMMIAGFGMIGFALRRRSTAVSYAA